MNRLSLAMATLLILAAAPVTVAGATANAQDVSAKSGSMTGFLEVVNRKALEVASTRKIRLAVIPIKGTESPRYGDKGFGTYLTEKISSSLVSTDAPIRLFERTRLDAVLKEQALSASGVFNESEARKIGELAPIDYILTGTFTRLERSIAVNLRFIDVVSGEVRGNLSENLELTADLAALFEELQARPVAVMPGKDQPPPCEAAWAPVKALMEDIGTPAKQDKLVDAAMAIPFEPPCGDIHYQVIGLFTRYKQYPPRYGQFLLQTLKKIENPDNDDRDGAIIRYLLIPGQLDDEAWSATLRLASVSKRSSLYSGWLFADKALTEASKQRVQTRVGVFLSWVDQKKIGRPVPVDAGKAFLDVLETLRHTYMNYDAAVKDVHPLMNCYQTFGPKYAKEADKKLLELLRGMYDAAGPGANREKILGWWCDRVNQFPPSRESADEVVDLMRKLFEAREAALKTDSTGGPAALELKRLANLSGKHIAELIPFIIGRDYRLDVTGFCLENGIQAPGVVPDLETLTKSLSSEDDTEQREAIRLLKHLGPGALPAEPAVLKRLRRSENKDDWDSQNKYLQHDLLGLLGAMRTRNPEAHRMLIHYLQDLESYVADESGLALAAIGEPAAAALKAEFPRIEEAYKQIRVIKIFQLRGKAAASHLPWLKSVMGATKSPYVRDAAEDAIDAISKS
jgi:hypothetical protein